jgi:hypothetical protein
MYGLLRRPDAREATLRWFFFMCHSPSLARSNETTDECLYRLRLDTSIVTDRLVPVKQPDIFLSSCPNCRISYNSHQLGGRDARVLNSVLPKCYGNCRQHILGHRRSFWAGG